jgi:hypothetical protein
MSAPPASLGRRVGVAAVVVIGVLLLPTLLVGLVAGPVAAAAFPFGAVGGVLVATGEGRAVAAALVPLVVAGGALTAATAGGWAWVVVLGVLGAAVGWMSTAGRAVAITEVAIVIAAASPLTGWRDLLVYAGFSGLGYLFGVLATRLVGAPERVPRARLTHIDPVRAAIVGAAALAGAGAIALNIGWAKPFWLPVSFLILLQFRLTSGDDDGWRMIALRVLGTYLGVVLLVPAVAWLPPAPQSVAVLVLLIGGLAITETAYWLSVALVTAAVVLAADGAGVDLLQIGEQRFGAVAIGVGLLMIVIAGLRWVRVTPGGDTAPSR